MWATAADPSPGQVAEAAPVGIQAIPGPGETRLLMVHFPPATVMFGDGFDPVEADREQLEHLPGLAELFEADCPGMHRTQSIDYDIVVERSGEHTSELQSQIRISYAFFCLKQTQHQSPLTRLEDY